MATPESSQQFRETRSAIKPSAQGGQLNNTSAVGYMPQVVRLLRERYPQHLSDSKQVAKFRARWPRPSRIAIC